MKRSLLYAVVGIVAFFCVLVVRAANEPSAHHPQQLKIADFGCTFPPFPTDPSWPPPASIEMLGLTGSAQLKALITSRDTAMVAARQQCEADLVSFQGESGKPKLIIKGEYPFATAIVDPDDNSSAAVAVRVLAIDSGQAEQINDCFRGAVLQLANPTPGVPVPTSVAGEWRAGQSYRAGSIVSSSSSLYISIADNNRDAVDSGSWLPLIWNSTMRTLVQNALGF